MPRVMIIGGSGVISRHTLAALLAKDDEVAVFRRGAEPAADHAAFPGDRHDTTALKQALAIFRPDVVIDFACFTRAEALGLTGAIPGSVAQVVFVSTVDVYGVPLPRLPMTETAPWGAPGSPYAAEKAATETALAAALAHRDVALTVVRPTYSMGAGFVISIFDRSARCLVARLRQGLPVPLPESSCAPDAKGLLHPSDARDTGRMIALTAAAPQAFGRTYTVGTPGSTMTHRDYVTLLADALNVDPDPVLIPRDFLETCPALPQSSLYHELTRFDLSYGFEQFLADFPGFDAQPDLRACIRAFAARTDASDPAVAQTGIEGEIMAAWRQHAHGSPV